MLSRARPSAADLGLLFGFAVMLVMFMAAETVERAADAGRYAALGAAAHERAFAFAASFRHGATDAWPVLMPGYFALGVAMAWWATGRDARQALPRAGLLLGVVTVASLAASSWLGGWPRAGFEAQVGVAMTGEPLAGTWRGALVGASTTGCFALLMWAAMRALATRRWRLLAVPLAPYLALKLARPPDDGARLVADWRHAFDDSPVRALVTVAAAVILSLLLGRRAWAAGSAAAAGAAGGGHANGTQNGCPQTRHTSSRTPSRSPTHST